MNPDIQQKIERIFYPYVAINSQSGTPAENLARDFFHSYFASIPYFIQRPDHYGSDAIPGDLHGRSVQWALVKGRGPHTVVLMHHFDVVEIEDYGLLKPLAFRPQELEQALRRSPDGLSAEARADLLSGRYLFGRGTADMKAGGAIQMALMEQFSREENFAGNLLLLAVPDEENLSAGMRRAASLMAGFKSRFGLQYALMINSEPHQRKTETVGVLSGGSIGKMMPFVYVRGILAHAGKSPEGFNPLSILSDVIRRTEMQLDAAEVPPLAGEVAPPPTWLMARDSKAVYDVSMPLSAFGCLSVLSLTNQPETVLQTLLDVCQSAAADMTARINRTIADFRRATGRPPCSQAWEAAVLTFEQYLAQLRAARGESFDALLVEISAPVIAALQTGAHTTASATWAMLDALAQLAEANQPVVIVGLLPPYYPSVSYLDRPEYTATLQRLTGALNDLTRSRWGQRYELEAYFTGISDLSYSSVNTAVQMEAVISRNMPLYGGFYNIPFQQIQEISMPCINIGPWGKDFHKQTERVLIEDLFEKTPEMLLTAIRTTLAACQGGG